MRARSQMAYYYTVAVVVATAAAWLGALSGAARAQEANIAFFIQISDETVDHLPRLLSRIHHAHNVYAVHIDRKVAPARRLRAQRELLAADAQYRANVLFMQSETVTYRGISMVLNTLNAMQQLLQRSARWHYLINLSGSDYPLVNSTTMRQLLGPLASQQLNFLTLNAAATSALNRRQRLQQLHVDPALSFGGAQRSSLLPLPQRNPLDAWLRVRFRSGEAWMIASRQLCIVATQSPFARKLLLTFAMSADAAEHFFATLVTNHAALRPRVVPHALRHVVWTLRGEHSGQHPFAVDALHHDEARRRALRAIVQCSPNLFIRKFRRPRSPLMALADAQHSNRSHVARVREHLRWALARRARATAA